MANASAIAKLSRMEKGQVIEPDDDGNLSFKATGFTSADGTKCDTHQAELIGAIGGSRGGVTHLPEYNQQAQQQRATG